MGNSSGGSAHVLRTPEEDVAAASIRPNCKAIFNGRIANHSMGGLSCYPIGSLRIMILIFLDSFLYNLCRNTNIIRDIKQQKNIKKEI